MCNYKVKISEANYSKYATVLKFISIWVQKLPNVFRIIIIPNKRHWACRMQNVVASSIDMQQTHTHTLKAAVVAVSRHYFCLIYWYNFFTFGHWSHRLRSQTMAKESESADFKWRRSHQYYAAIAGIWLRIVNN